MSAHKYPSGVNDPSGHIYVSMLANGGWPANELSVNVNQQLNGLSLIDWLMLCNVIAGNGH